MRLPFVDHKLVETFIGLRKAGRDDHLPPKYWLKESVRDLLGDEILDRPKRGFAPPGVRWQKLLRTHFGADLRNGFLVEQGILTREYASRLTKPEVASPAEAIVSRLAIILEIWARGVILEEDMSSDPEASQVDAA
jgi:asparagine synthase (glutamine-hydrolysing)